MLKILSALLLAVFITGCSTPQTIVKVEHVLVAPADNLLVDCDIEPPPVKADYLKAYDSTVSTEKLTIANDVALTQYNKALHQASYREQQLTTVSMKNYRNAGICNARWKALRQWKLDVTKELGASKDPGGRQ